MVADEVASCRVRSRPFEARGYKDTEQMSSSVYLQEDCRRCIKATEWIPPQIDR